MRNKIKGSELTWGCNEGIPAVLDRARDLTDGVLLAEIGRLHPKLADVAAYHIGGHVAGEMGVPAGARGKGVCMALPILAAEAAGADAATGVPGAVALELVHVFSHMHDDIMDSDVLRRHRKSAWKEFGVGPAMLTGDALFTLAMRLLVAEGENLEPIRCLVDACLDIAAGQALDLAYECTALEDVSLEGYMEMAGGKTGALYACALSIGGELAGASRVVIDTLRKAGHELGMVAQEVDDINGTWGDPSVCGKPVLSDLMRRKKSLPVVAMLHRAEDGVRSRFLELWSAEERTDANAQEMLSLLNAACAAEFCQEQAEQHYRRALVYLDGLDMPGPVRIELADLAYFIRHRRS